MTPLWCGLIYCSVFFSVDFICGAWFKYCKLIIPFGGKACILLLCGHCVGVFMLDMVGH